MDKDINDYAIYTQTKELDTEIKISKEFKYDEWSDCQ